MRILLLFSLLLFTSSINAQSIDTTIKHRVLDSMQQVIYRLKDSNYRLKYENEVLAHVTRVDSQRIKDTIIINYLSNKNKLLKREVQKLRAEDCVYYRSVSYFNHQSLPEFVEYYERSCLTKKEAEEHDVIFEKIIYSYERYEYDSSNRIAARINWYPTVKARRFEYSYDKNGKETVRYKKIKEGKFWD